MKKFEFIMKKGDKGQEVARLQRKLNIGDDGKFGPQTEAHVKDFQGTVGLDKTGIANAETLRLLGIEVLPGTDVSAWQGKVVDFDELYESGMRFNWVKTTEGTTHKNRGFEDKFKGSREAGLATGGYHFGRPDTYSEDPLDWQKEADNFLTALDRVGGVKCGDLVPAYDLEGGNKSDDKYNVDWVLKWLDYVGKETGTTPIIYTARWAYQLYVMKAPKDMQKELAKYPLWLASYNTGTYPKRKVKIWDEWDVWQYSGKGKAPGIKTKADLNWMAGEALLRLTK